MYSKEKKITGGKNHIHNFANKKFVVMGINQLFIFFFNYKFLILKIFNTSGFLFVHFFLIIIIYIFNASYSIDLCQTLDFCLSRFYISFFIIFGGTVVRYITGMWCGRFHKP